MSQNFATILSHIENKDFHQAEMMLKAQSARLIKSRNLTVLENLVESCLEKLLIAPPADIKDVRSQLNRTET